MHRFFKYLYLKRRMLLNIVPFAFLGLVLLSIAWLLRPSLVFMEPLIVLVGFIVATLQLLPTAILNAYPDVKYVFRVEAVFGGFYPNEAAKGFLCVNADISDPANEALTSFQPFIQVRNVSDETARLKGVEISNNALYETSKAGVFLPKILDLPPNESTHLQLTPLADTLTEEHFVFVVFEDGCKVQADQGATPRLLLAWKTFQAHRQGDG